MSSENLFVSVLQKIREPIANYQCSKGIPRSQNLSFINVMILMCKHAYSAFCTIWAMLYELLPFMDIFIYFIRFTLDKLIDIIESETLPAKVLKSLLLLLEVLIFAYITAMIISIVLLPIVKLIEHYAGKVWKAIQ